MTRARAAVVGCGAIAHEHLGFLGSSPLVDLVGVCDTSPAASAFAADRFGAAAPFVDLDTMLTDAAPDVLHVLTPPNSHEAIATLGLDRGCHVLCEKPAFPDASTLKRVLQRADDAGRHLMESQNLRWNDPVLQAHALAGDGSLGDVREVEVTLALDLTGGRFGDLNLAGRGVDLPGGAVHDFLPHLAYLFLMFADAPVDEVIGHLLNRSGNPRVGFDSLDCILVAGDVRGRLKIASDLLPAAFRLVVRGTKGSVETDLYSPYLRREGGANIGKRVALEHVSSGARLAWSGFTSLRDKVMQHDTYHGIPRMLHAFYTALRDGSPMPVSPADMVASAQLTDRLVGLWQPS